MVNIEIFFNMRSDLFYIGVYVANVDKGQWHVVTLIWSFKILVQKDASI